MSKSQAITNTNNIVKEVLKSFPATRNSDDLLYGKVCEKISGNVLNMPFWEVIYNRKKYGFPSYETVSRTRRNIQRHYPELSAISDVEAQRLINEDAFIAYARKATV